MIRYCPNCRTERPLTEFFCGGEIDGSPCNWDLSSEGIHPEGWRPPRLVAELTAPFGPSLLRPVCANGHPLEEGDLLCPECGAQAALPPAEPAGGAEREIRRIDAWAIQSALPPTAASFERYAVRHQTSGQEATLHLFRTGFEPETPVYEALQRLPLEHVPRLFAWGRWENRFYSVAESFSGQNLADLGAVIADEAGARHIVKELGEALHSLTEAGIRHRDLKPADLVVRAGEPLDLVISGFGSARLSDFDLDIVAPLETSLYMAPEVIAGAVSPASDWWSLGMILLEQLTGGGIFAGIHERAFVIQVLSNGISIPDSLSPALQTLLKGLLTRDHRARWQWPQVKAWLEGRFVELAPEHLAFSSPARQSAAIVLGGQRYANPEQFALRAAEAENWEEARSLLRGGGLGVWLASLVESFPENAKLREIGAALARMQTGEGAEIENWDSDRRFMLVLKLLNPAMPLVIRGELLSPGWLLANPREGYALINSDIPRLLSGCLPDEANWLLRLQTRERQIRERARSLDIPLNEDALRIYSLNTSQSRLAVIWAERLKAYPETDHPGAALLLERRNLTDSDCIILLSADLSLFSPVRELLDASFRLAETQRIASFSRDEAERLTAVPRRDLHRALQERLRDFAYSGNTALDQWAREYRIRRRLPLAKILAILATPAGGWITPPRQRHIQELFSYFDRKIAAAGVNGPLARMRTDERSSNLDFSDLATERTPAAGLVNHILGRAPRTVALDPAIFDEAARSMSGRRDRPRSARERTAEIRTGADARAGADVWTGGSEAPLGPVQTGREIQTGPEAETGRPGAVSERGMAGRLGRLQSRNDSYFRDTGINGLYAGFPFIIYRADQAAREPRVMPLLLWPARLEGSAFSRIVRLGFDPDREEVRLNPFLEAVVGPESCKRWEEAANELLSRSNIDVREAMSILSAAADETEEELRRLTPQERLVPVGKQRLLCSAVLFHAAFAGQAVSEELRLLARTAVVPGAMGTVFGLYAPPLPAPSAAAPSFFVTHRDPSQEKAVQESRSPQGLLIEGPPGTGKSQTIVNMISQALGDKRSVLVVCQKRAALNVVHKRLTAEGLSGRIIMLTDSGRERAAVISAVRSQMEQYFTDTTPSAPLLEQEKLLLLMERLEAKLGAAHPALHDKDPQCGCSYLTIIEKLIELHGKTAGIQAPQLRGLLAQLTAAQLDDILENCAPLVRLWLASRYEESPLLALVPFTPDSSSVAALQKDLEALRQAEKERALEGKRAGRAKAPAKDALFARWYASHGAAMKTMGEKELALARHCLPLSKTQGRLVSGSAVDALTALIETLEITVYALAKPSRKKLPSSLALLVAALPENRLYQLNWDASPWTKGIGKGIMALSDIFSRRRLSSLLRRAEMDPASPEDSATVRDALRFEVDVRPWRKKLRDIFLKLGLEESSAEDEIPRLAALARQTLQTLRALVPLLTGLTQLPEASRLEKALLQGERAAVLAELARLGAAAERQASRSLELLDVLGQRFTPEALTQFREAMIKGEKTLPLLEALQTSLSRVEAFMAFQKRRAALPETAMRLFALLRRQEDALTALDPAELAPVFRRIVRAEALLAWKERLEIQNPLLGLERDELESKDGPRRTAGPSLLLRIRERKRLLLLIAKLEAEIYASHQALYNHDPQCGYSYRIILNKLIDLQGQTAGIQAPQLRGLLAPLSAAQVDDILEDCAPLATLWLASRYEESPLRALEVFTPDDASAAVLREDLESFRQAEQERSARGDHTASYLPSSQGAIFAQWYASHGAAIETMGEKDLAAVRRCLPLFKAPGQSLSLPAGDALLRELEEIAEALAACPMAEYSVLFSPLAAALPEGRLDALYRDSAPDALSFLQLCAPWRILGRMRLSSLLRQAGLAASPEAKAEVHGAARLEGAVRPLRKGLRNVFLRLGLEPAAEDEILRLAALTRQTLQALRALAPLLSSLVQLPEASQLENAFFQGESAAVLTELARFKAASERHALSVRSLKLLDVLAQRFTVESVEQFRKAITKGEKTPPLLEALQTSMSGIKPFMAFKKRRAALPETAMRLFALLRRHEDALTALDPAELAPVFRRVVRAEAFLAWKERLEIQHPLLGMERDELESKVETLKESDAGLRDLNRNILARSINPEKIGPRKRWVEITRLSGQRARRLRQFIAEGAEIGLLSSGRSGL